MKYLSKYNISHIIAILWMLLLCVPCTIKRDIKLSLGLPASAQVNFHKNGAPQHCSVIEQNNESSGRRLIKNADSNVPLPGTSFLDPSNNLSAFSIKFTNQRILYSKAVPLYLYQRSILI